MARKCPRCGAEDARGSLACAECGQPLQPPPRSLAALSKLLGFWSVPLLCLFGVGFFVGIFAILLGIAALVRAGVGRSTEGVRDAVVGILVAGLPMGLAALLALPGLRASRVASNESTTIGDLRSMLQAELDYAKANGDLYDTFACLAAPARCLLDAPPSVMALPPELQKPERWGYRRTFHAGPPAKTRPKGASASSLSMFAVVAVPLDPGWTGRRSFCADGTGRICARDDGAPPEVVAGQCAPSCPDLR